MQAHSLSYWPVTYRGFFPDEFFRKKLNDEARSKNVLSHSRMVISILDILSVNKLLNSKLQVSFVCHSHFIKLLVTILLHFKFMEIEFSFPLWIINLYPFSLFGIFFKEQRPFESFCLCKILLFSCYPFKNNFEDVIYANGDKDTNSKIIIKILK